MFEIKDKKIWYLIFIYGLVTLIFHFAFLEVGGGDDIYFMTCLENKTLGEFLVKRWNKWSSRLVIETVVVLVLKQAVWVWKTIDVLVSILLAYLLFGILYHKKETSKAPLLCGLLFILYDFREMSSAGYMTTTIFYWWVLAAGMLAFLPIYFDYRGEQGRTWLWILGIPCALFAANQEQMAIILACGCIYMLGLYLYEKRKAPIYLYGVLLIALFCLLLVVICPGNAVRKTSNIEFWFPSYADFHLVQKGLLGWYGVLRSLFEDVNWLFFGFSIVLMTAVWKKSRNRLERMIAAVPALSNVALLACVGISHFYDAGPVNKVVHAFDFDQPIVYYQGALPTKLRLLMLVYTLVCLCVVVSLFILWGMTKKCSHRMAVLVIGTISKMSMGISPTVWASSERTSLFLWISLIIIGASCGEFIFRKKS